MAINEECKNILEQIFREIGARASAGYNLGRHTEVLGAQVLGSTLDIEGLFQKSQERYGKDVEKSDKRVNELIEQLITCECSR